VVSDTTCNSVVALSPGLQLEDMVVFVPVGVVTELETFAA
jgi:hypothetical protein